MNSFSANYSSNVTMLQFHIDLPVSWILLGAAVVLALTAWLEVKRTQKFLILRLSALCLAVIALLGLILNPSLQQRKTSDYIILTKNYNTRTFDSLTAKYSAGRLYQMPGAAPATKASVIENYRSLDELKGNIHLLGDGFPAYMLEYLDTTALHYYPSDLPEGFTNLNLQKKYKQHQVNTLEGTFNPAGKSFTLKLTGSAQTEDSVTVSGKQHHTFALKFSPKTSGNFIYTLTAVDSTGKIAYSERVPVQIPEQKPLSILVLSDFPTAETRFLKNYLEAENHQLTLRYGISKNTYRTEFINTPKKGAVALSAAALAAYDLVILDLPTLTSLPDARLHELKQAVQNGLGILTLFNTPAPIAKKATDFLEVKLSSFKTDTASITLSSGIFKNAAAPVRLETTGRLFPVLSERDGRVISGYRQSGLGKLGFQLLTHTYRLQLAGEKERYAELWAGLIEETARQELQDHSVSMTTAFPFYEDEPLLIEIVSATGKPEVNADRVQLPLMESLLVSNVWQAKTWAGVPGWHTLSVNNTPHAIFVCNPHEWNAMRVTHQQQLLKNLSGDPLKSSSQIVYQPVAPVIFYLLFLAAAGFLWLAPKL